VEKRPTLKITGPVVPFYSGNIFQFDSFYSEFDSDRAILYAKLADTNAAYPYSIELQTPTREHIKTIPGSTSNGVIQVDWNLIDDKGNKFTNDSLNAVFHVTLPNSRSETQTLKMFEFAPRHIKKD
jgi:hypothetical protein